jgi:hypothetical protein
MNRPAKLLFEGEAGWPPSKATWSRVPGPVRKRVVALPTEGATLAPIIESAELYVRRRDETGLPLHEVGAQ